MIRVLVADTNKLGLHVLKHLQLLAETIALLLP
jgi:hypothetical protein